MLGTSLTWLALAAWLGAVHGQEGWQLFWSDEFDKFDFNNWQHEITAWGGGNYEFQSYTNLEENCYVDQGTLFLKPTLTADRYGEDVFTTGSINMFSYGFCSNDGNWGCFRENVDVPPVLSARIRSYQRFSFKFKKLVVDAKMPAGDWLWPAIWLLPEDWEFGEWPRSGEIDLIESIGNRDLVYNPTGDQIGVERMGATLHWGPAWNVNWWDLSHAVRDSPDHNYADHFHQYEMEWSETQMIFRVDGDHVLSVPTDEQLAAGWPGFWDHATVQEGRDPAGHTNPWEGHSDLAPFDKEFHIIMNVAVGGLNGFIPDDVTNAGGARPKPWNNGMGTRDAYAAFWADRDNWYPTWQEDDAAMQIRSVRIYEPANPIPFEEAKKMDVHETARTQVGPK